MKDNVKSGLNVKYIIGVILTLAVVSGLVQTFNFTKSEIQLAKAKELEEQKQAEVQVASTNERDIATSRSAEEREIETVSAEQNQYIPIDEIEISKDMDLTITCGVSKEDFQELMSNLKTDSTGFFAENSDTIYDLCQEYEINEIFLCGLIAAESGWKISSNHRNTCNYISMMSGGSLIRYSSPEEGLEAAVKLLHNKYLTEGGSCYYGKTISAVQTRFCPNSSTWVGLVYGCMKQVV